MTPKTLSKETIEYLNSRLGDEYTAHYHYRECANYADNVGYLKAAAYYTKEAEDELAHAKMLQDYANQWNVKLKMPALNSPKPIKSLEMAIEVSYDLEYSLLELYNKDSSECLESGDINTFDFLKQFRDIQQKSVAEVSTQLNILELFDKSDKNWLFSFEKRLFG